MQGKEKGEKMHRVPRKNLMLGLKVNRFSQMVDATVVEEGGETSRRGNGRKI